ncbi:acetyltransferase (GNAT) family protein [Sphingomonas sp. PP-CE-3A-406]|uniref:GNAT family N-acetyltransferase n=1 Tax=Sphingomonas sp. PP-CE-3A-406 TaxID=2135659 RepID=UPI000F1E8543|nr:GNAT family N-acetyltransferase [Sphingomonas sp. PP-CE-3A-406]RMB51845.1 acetyltransferase (GNAT) family protein [Sphingomonas sp. PP-CE-3A-406]
MNTRGVDPDSVYAWLCGRSLARVVPQPVADQGGFRVDTGTEAEISRWVFPMVGPGLVALARGLQDPRYLLKLCGEADELRSILPGGWQVEGGNFFMQSSGARFEAAPVDAYAIDVVRNDAVIAVRILAEDGTLAASGYAGETPDAFAYDRIATAPAHRRQGLGRAVMAALQGARRYPGTPERLVATEAGRALYERLGWRTLSAYSTATFVRP